MALAAHPSAGRGRMARSRHREDEDPAPRAQRALADTGRLVGRAGPAHSDGRDHAGVARELARAAAADPTCVWRVVVTDAAGQVIAVTQVRWPGRTYRKSEHPPGPGVLGPGVLGRITVTVPVMLLGEPPPRSEERRV